jgi:hypothetical protein
MPERDRVVIYDGILHRKRIRIQDFNLVKLGFCLSVIVVLFATNPAHYNDTRPLPSSGINWLSKLKINKKTQDRKITNYFLFSLSKQGKGIGVEVFMNHFRICDYNGRAAGVCKWASHTFCKETAGKHPFIVLRFLLMTKLLFYILQCCYKLGCLCPSADGYWAPFTALLSVFHQPRWHVDLLAVFYFLYPWLELIQRISVSGTSSENSAVVHFYFLSFLFIVVLGGIANIISNVLTKEKVRGMKGSMAAALGFMTAAKPNKIICDWMDSELTSGNILFLVFAVTVTTNLFGFGHRYGVWSMSDVISWTAGGLLGYGLCGCLLNYYDLWWWTF